MGGTGYQSSSASLPQFWAEGNAPAPSAPTSRDPHASQSVPQAHGLTDFHPQAAKSTEIPICASTSVSRNTRTTSAYFSQLTQKPFIKTVLVKKEIGLAWILHHYRLFTLLWDCLHLENDFRYDQNNRFEKEICSKSYEISLLYKSCFPFKFPIHSELLL